MTLFEMLLVSKLLDICKSTDLRIVNGHIEEDI